jgi:hypothetical protein
MIAPHPSKVLTWKLSTNADPKLSKLAEPKSGFSVYF